MNSNNDTRRYDVDWLRVIAFVTLIFYHIGMVYVADWGWHVKSDYQSELLHYPMLLVNQWRMPLIFFISGFAVSMVEEKITAKQLLKIRFLRVFIPLVIGMLLIVPPQLYYQALQSYNLTLSYWAFLIEYWNPNTSLLPSEQHSPLGLLTWNHLWYLAYLWCYTIIYLLIRPCLRPVTRMLARLRISAIMIFLLPVFILTLYGLYLKPLFPRTHALTDDWYNHALSFSVFIFGYIAAKSNQIWRTIIKRRNLWLSGAIIAYLSLMTFHKMDWMATAQVGSEWPLQFLVYANVWAWLLAVIGFAGAYLNRPSPILRYLNEAILPWYIVHQTITIIIVANLAPFGLGGALEPILVICGTFALCAIAYAAIRRLTLLRFVFGMKLN